MWRLKVGEGANDPYLYSTNNFVGRQTWEFDPNYGTPEDIQEVEDARRDFYNNRFKVKPCNDLLWRFQVWIPSSSLHCILFVASIALMASLICWIVDLITC